MDRAGRISEIRKNNKEVGNRYMGTEREGGLNICDNEGKMK